MYSVDSVGYGFHDQGREHTDEGECGESIVRRKVRTTHQARRRQVEGEYTGRCDEAAKERLWQALEDGSRNALEQKQTRTGPGGAKRSHPFSPCRKRKRQSSSEASAKAVLGGGDGREGGGLAGCKRRREGAGWRRW